MNTSNTSYGLQCKQACNKQWYSWTQLVDRSQGDDFLIEYVTVQLEYNYMILHISALPTSTHFSYMPAPITS